VCVEVYLNSFLTPALEGGVLSASRPGRLYPRERPDTHCTEGWVGPGAGRDKCGKSRSTGIFFVKHTFINLVSYTTDSSWHSARYTNSITCVIIEQSPQAV
jgi:hypothetical protein